MPSYTVPYLAPYTAVSLSLSATLLPLTPSMRPSLNTFLLIPSSLPLLLLPYESFIVVVSSICLFPHASTHVCFLLLSIGKVLFFSYSYTYGSTCYNTYMRFNSCVQVYLFNSLYLISTVVGVFCFHPTFNWIVVCFLLLPLFIRASFTYTVTIVLFLTLCLFVSRGWYFIFLVCI